MSIKLDECIAKLAALTGLLDIRTAQRESLLENLHDLEHELAWARNERDGLWKELAEAKSARNRAELKLLKAKEKV